MQINVTEKKTHKTPREHAPVGRRTVATLGILLLSGFLSRSASAQVVAMHAAVKRPVPEAQTALEGAASAEITAQQAKQQQAWQKRSEQRDRAYVRLLLQRGTPKEKLGSRLLLTTQFARLNPHGDVHAYVRRIIDQVKDNSRPLQHPSPASPQVAAPSAISQSSGTDQSNPSVVADSSASNQAPANSNFQTGVGGVLVQTAAPQSIASSPSKSTGSTLSSGSASSPSRASTSTQSGTPVTTANPSQSNQSDSESSTINSAQGPGGGAIGPGPGCNLLPAPASIGTSVPLSYFGPPPSDTNRSLVGPVQLLNTGQVDAANGTITIPLYLGHLKGSGKNVWYILTDVDDPNVAAELGLNFSAKLTFASHSARTGNLDADGNIVFDAGTVNFAPERKIIPGPPGHEFPPTFATPGSVGDANYGPLVQITNAANVIYNAPMVAFDVDASEINFPKGNVDYSKVHDQVVAIDPINMTVTLNLINGFSFGRPVWYLSMDTSNALGAAIEHNTLAPLMQGLLLGQDDTFASPVERIFISTNGPESGSCNNPLRQGLSADLADGFRPNNVLGGIPTIALDYSPYWDAQLFEWTQDAIDQGFRGQVREEFQILTFVQDGLITGPGGKAFGSSGFSINCPIVQRLD